MATARIEHHPENGRAPHIVVVEGANLGRGVWFAYETVKRAEEKRPWLEKQFTDAEKE